MDIKQLYDETGVPYIPVVHVNAVLDNDGNPIQIGGNVSGNYLRKDQPDSTEYLLSLLGGITSPRILSENFVAGASGFILTKGENRSKLEIDDIIARGKFQVNTLEIKRKQYMQGSQVLSFAGCKIDKVEGFIYDGGGIIENPTVDDAANIEYYTLYWLREKEGTFIKNDWAPGDLAHCKELNISRQNIDGTAQARSREWYRLVLYTGEDAIFDGKTYNWIVVSNATQDGHSKLVEVDDGINSGTGWSYYTACGNDVPKAGDEVVQEGNVINADRRGLIELDVENVSYDVYNNVGYRSTGILDSEDRQYNWRSNTNNDRHPIRLSPSESWISASNIRIGGQNILSRIPNPTWIDASSPTIRIDASGNIQPQQLTVDEFVNDGTIHSSGSRINVDVYNPNGESWHITDGWSPVVVDLTTIESTIETSLTDGFYIKVYTSNNSLDIPVITDAIQGEAGESEYIVSLSTMYAVGVSGTVAPDSGWQLIVPPVEPGKYLWVKVVLQFHSGAEITYYSVSRMGEDGRGIKSSVVTYSQQENPVNPENIQNWGSFPSDVEEGWWLYTKTHVVYSDDTYTDSYDVSQIGTGSHYAGAEEWYCAGSRNSIAPSGFPTPGTYVDGQRVPIGPGWSLIMPNMTSSSPYLWNFEISYDSSGNKYVTAPICIGNFIKGISSVVESYAISAYSTPAQGLEYPSDITNESWHSHHYNAVPTEEKPYLWNRTVTTYNDDTVEIGYHISAVRGANGESTCVFDLDNQMDAVPVDGNNKVMHGTTITVYASLKKGSDLITDLIESQIPSLVNSLTIEGVAPSIVLQSNKLRVRWTFSSSVYLQEAKYTVNIPATYEGQTYYAVFTLIASKNASIYQLAPNPDTISFSRDASGNLTPSVVYVKCGWSKTTGSEVETHTGSAAGSLYNIDGKYNILYRPVFNDGRFGAYGWWKDLENFRLAVSSDTIYKGYEVVFTTSNSAADIPANSIIDYEYIPIVKDGAKGQDGSGQNAKFYKLNPKIEQMLNYNEQTPDGQGGTIYAPQTKVNLAYEIYKVDGNVTTEITSAEASQFKIRWAHSVTAIPETGWEEISPQTTSTGVIYQVTNRILTYAQGAPHSNCIYVELYKGSINPANLQDRRPIPVTFATDAYINVIAEDGIIDSKVQSGTTELSSRMDAAEGNITNITTTVNAQGGVISEHASLILQNSNSISTKVSQSDYDTKTGQLDLQYSEFLQTADDFRLRFSNDEQDILNIQRGNITLNANTTVSGDLLLKGNFISPFTIAGETYEDLDDPDNPIYRYMPFNVFYYGGTYQQLQVDDVSTEYIYNLVIGESRFSDRSDASSYIMPVVVLPTTQSWKLDTNKYTAKFTGVDGLKLTISNPYNSKYSKWKQFDTVENPGTYSHSGVSLTERCVLICSDPRLMSYSAQCTNEYSSLNQWVPSLSGEESDTQYTNIVSRMLGNMVCNGQRGRMLILAPGQNVSLIWRKAKYTDGNGLLFDYYYWQVENSSEFQDVGMQFVNGNKSQDNVFTHKLILPVGDSFGEDDNIRNIYTGVFASRAIGASAANNDVNAGYGSPFNNWYPELYILYRDSDFNNTTTVTPEPTSTYLFWG